MKRIAMVLGLLLVAHWLVPAPAAALTINASVSWPDVTNEEGYKVERAATLAGPWTQIGQTAPGVTALVDPNLQPGTNYCYRVIAFNQAGSLASEGLCGPTMSPPAYTGPGTWAPTVIYQYNP